MEPRPWRLLEILRQTAGFFAARGLASPRLQAEILLGDVLGLRRLDLYLQFERLLTPAEVDAYRDHVRRRAQRVPVQYITGRAGFRRLDLEVGPEVLIPRPETEVLVDAALRFVAPRCGPAVMDLGCGSGAIALAIASEHPSARLVAADISEAALGVARANAQRHGLEPRLEFLCGDLFTPLRARPDLLPLDTIVSNPPYVPSGDLAGLAPEVRDHEPRLALEGGADGLTFHRRIAAEAWEFLTAGGGLFVEVGDGQAAAVQGLLEAAGRYDQIGATNDLNRVPRVVSARRAPG
ncbi:MAG: peptide chain release factor N(5)-glutamine methyltransferase [Candidatus Latescibacterota bacterium]